MLFLSQRRDDISPIKRAEVSPRPSLVIFKNLKLLYKSFRPYRLFRESSLAV